MRSVRISDEAYAKIARKAKKDKRTITATIDILIDEAQEGKKAAPNTSPYPPIDWESIGGATTKW